MENVVQSTTAETEESSKERKSLVISHKISHKEQEEKAISSQFSGGYAPSFLPWTDHGRTKASVLPSCGCQRDASADSKPVSKQNNDVVLLSQLIVVFMSTFFCLLQFFIYKLT